MDRQRGYRTVLDVWQDCLCLIKGHSRSISDDMEIGRKASAKLALATSRSDGATTIEYGLIAAIVALGIIAGLDEVEAAIEFLYSYIDTETEGVTDRLAAE